jgi:amino acid transporter
VLPISGPENTVYNLHQIAGVIGTGLFLGLGQLLAITGPLGVLLVFLLVGSVAFAFVLLVFSIRALILRYNDVPCSSIVSVTEMAVFAPVSGSFIHYGMSNCPRSGDLLTSSVSAARWVDPALGFAVSLGKATGFPLVDI